MVFWGNVAQRIFGEGASSDQSLLGPAKVVYAGNGMSALHAYCDGSYDPGAGINASAVATHQQPEKPAT
jgi:hypothetical protein